MTRSETDRGTVAVLASFRPGVNINHAAEIWLQLCPVLPHSEACAGTQETLLRATGTYRAANTPSIINSPVLPFLRGNHSSSSLTLSLRPAARGDSEAGRSQTRTVGPSGLYWTLGKTLGHRAALLSSTL